MRAVKFILFLLLSLFTVQWGIAWLADMMYRGNFYGQSGGQIKLLPDDQTTGNSHHGVFTGSAQPRSG